MWILEILKTSIVVIFFLEKICVHQRITDGPTGLVN